MIGSVDELALAILTCGLELRSAAFTAGHPSRFAWLDNPRAGDLVIECSSFAEDPDRVGIFVGRGVRDGEDFFELTTFHGETKRWFNATVSRIPKDRAERKELFSL